MIQNRINSMQDVLTKRILQVIEWSERKFKRIVMSYDASNNPAELYGDSGKIYYRKDGGTGIEIGSGVGLWEVGSVGTTPTINPITWQDVCVDDMWIKDAGSGYTSDLTIHAASGGGGGEHPYQEVEV